MVNTLSVTRTCSSLPNTSWLPSNAGAAPRVTPNSGPRESLSLVSKPRRSWGRSPDDASSREGRGATTSPPYSSSSCPPMLMIFRPAIWTKEGGGE